MADNASYNAVPFTITGDYSGLGVRGRVSIQPVPWSNDNVIQLLGREPTTGAVPILLADLDDYDSLAALVCAGLYSYVHPNGTYTAILTRLEPKVQHGGSFVEAEAEFLIVT